MDLRLSLQLMKLFKLTLSCNCTGETLRVAKQYVEAKVASTVEVPVKDILSKATNRNFGIRRGDKLGFMITVYGKKAATILSKVEGKVNKNAINQYGVCQVGLAEYTQLTMLPYLPELPSFGFSLNFTVSNLGWGAQFKKRAPGKAIYVDKNEVKEYLQTNYKNIELE